jgi:hypothetical protein
MSAVQQYPVSIIPNLVKSGGSSAKAKEADAKQTIDDDTKTGKQTKGDVLVIAEGKRKQNGPNGVELSEVKTHTVVGRWNEWQMAALRPGREIKLAQGKSAVVLYNNNKPNTMREDFTAGVSVGLKGAIVPAVISIGASLLKQNPLAKMAEAIAIGWLAGSVLGHVGSGLLERKQEDSKNRANTAR